MTTGRLQIRAPSELLRRPDMWAFITSRAVLKLKVTLHDEEIVRKQFMKRQALPAP